MGKIGCLVILSYFLILSFTQMRQTQAFVVGVRHGKRTLPFGDSKLEESDPNNEQLGAGIGKSAPLFRVLSFQYIWAFSSHLGDFALIYHQFLRTNFVKNVRHSVIKENLHFEVDDNDNSMPKLEKTFLLNN